MKKLLILILIIYSSFIYSQPASTNRIGYWRANVEGINTADSTLTLGIYTIKLSDVDFNMTSGIIPFRTKCKFKFIGTAPVDTGFWNYDIPPCVVFNNIDYSNTTFFKTVDRILNSDSTELSYAGISEIAIYSSSLTGADRSTNATYFNVKPMTGKCFSTTKGSDATGDGSVPNPYATFSAAAAATTNSVYMLSGKWNMNTTSVTLSDSLIGVGYSYIYNCASNYPFYNNKNDGYLKGIYAKLDSTTAYFTLLGARNTNTLNNYVLNSKTNCFSGSASATDFLTNFENNVFISCGNNTGTRGMESKTTRTSIIGNYIDFYGNDVLYLRDATPTYGKQNFNYNNVVGTLSNNIIYSDKNIETYNLIGNIIGNHNLISLGNINGSVNCTANTGSVKILVNFTGGSGDVKIRHNILSTNASGGVVIKTLTRNLDVSFNNFNDNGTGQFILCRANSQISFNMIGNDITATRGYASTFVGDGTDANNQVKSRIYNNKITWVVAAGNHGIQIYDHSDCIIEHNFVINCRLPYIFKGDAADFSTAYIRNNIAINGNIVIKGVLNSNVYNNTIIGDINYDGYNIDILKNVAFGCTGTKVYNNIFAKFNPSSTKQNIYIEDAGITYTFNNNTIYNSTYKARVQTTNKWFNEWQSLGNDLESDSLNPNLNNITNDELWLTRQSINQIGKGKKLDNSNSNSLLKNSIIPTDINIETQGVKWDKGAYTSETRAILNKSNPLEFNNKILQIIY